VTEARRLLVSKDQYARNKLLPLALIEDCNGHFDHKVLAASARVCCQLDQRSFGGTITNERDAPRGVYRWVCRLDMPERNAMVPKPCAPAYSERSWHEAVPTRRPRPVTCFLIYVIVDTRVCTAIWHGFSLPGAAVAYRTMVYLLLTRMRRLHSRCMW
jgi:hypothetical protein